MTVSSAGSPASSCKTVSDWPGKIKSGAISLNGCKTNLRWNARGCGKIKSGKCRTSVLNVIKSKSSGRGSLRIIFGRRPNSFSSACNFSSKVSGVSFVRGVKLTTAFTNFGESGGQSTGDVCHSEEFRFGVSENCCSRVNADKIFFCESPRLEPRATKASFEFLIFSFKFKESFAGKQLKIKN